MRRVVVTYLIDSGDKNEKGEVIKRGMWANEGKYSVKPQDIQIFDANTGELIGGIIDVTININGAGLTGKMRTLLMTKNPDEGKEAEIDGKIVKAPSFIPLLDTRGNNAFTDEECVVVEISPLNQDTLNKLKSIKDIPSQMAEDIKEKIAKTAEEADLTKETK
jgi:hypothetical protein